MISIHIEYPTVLEWRGLKDSAIFICVSPFLQASFPKGWGLRVGFYYIVVSAFLSIFKDPL